MLVLLSVCIAKENTMVKKLSFWLMLGTGVFGLVVCPPLAVMCGIAFVLCCFTGNWD